MHLPLFDQLPPAIRIVACASVAAIGAISTTNSARHLPQVLVFWFAIALDLAFESGPMCIVVAALIVLGAGIYAAREFYARRDAATAGDHAR